MHHSWLRYFCTCTRIKSLPHVPVTPDTTTSEIIPFPELCPEGLFRCNSGQCIRPDQKCDGRRDCQDNSDEIDCGECFSTEVAIKYGYRVLSCQLNRKLTLSPLLKLAWCLTFTYTGAALYEFHSGADLICIAYLCIAELRGLTELLIHTLLNIFFLFRIVL